MKLIYRGALFGYLTLIISGCELLGLSSGTSGTAVDSGCKLIDFEADANSSVLASGEEVDTEYSDYGITFTHPSNYPRVIANAVDPNDAIPTSGNLLLGGNPTTGFDVDLTITFSSPVVDISFQAIDVEAAGTVEYYDESDTLVTTQDLDSLATGQAQKKTLNGIYISKIVLKPSDGIFIDDLRYCLE